MSAVSPASSIHLLPPNPYCTRLYGLFRPRLNGKRDRELALGGPASLPLRSYMHKHTHLVRRALVLMLAFICIRRQRVADWCGARLMIKANMKQIGLHGEMGNVTGMVWYSLSLCCKKANSRTSLISYFRMIKSLF